MIVRSTLRSSTTRLLLIPRTCKHRLSTRRFSSSSTLPNPSTSAPPASMLGAFKEELDRIGPKFDIHGSQVQILQEPKEFYEALKSKILSAEKRIFLSTLYIGKTEHELISVLQQALRAKPQLKLSILTDALRGTRESPDPSCASLLAPLVSEFGADRVEIRMYHTPNLTGLRKKYIPKRINEGWGLQHMKLYGMDDEIIISGANLSSDYFSDRQDRYHVFSCAQIVSYFASVHHAVSSLSFLVTPDSQLPAGYMLEWPTSNVAPSPLDAPDKYIERAAAVLTPIISSTSSTQPDALYTTGQTVQEPNTTIYPISQLTPFFSDLKSDKSTELPAVSAILNILQSPAAKSSSWTFTAGYFNPSPSLTTLLLRTTSTNNTVITASPWANGFYGSKGVSGLLPAAYTLLARRFLERAEKQGRKDDVALKEWRRGTVGEKDGWTYHAKGLWVSVDGEKEPSVTVVGSSNYTKRSYTLDLETGVVIVTRDEGLKQRLRKEKDNLGGEWAKEVGMDEFVKTERRVSIKVRVAMWIVSLVGGAL